MLRAIQFGAPSVGRTASAGGSIPVALVGILPNVMYTNEVVSAERQGDWCVVHGKVF